MERSESRPVERREGFLDPYLFELPRCRMIHVTPTMGLKDSARNLRHMIEEIRPEDLHERLQDGEQIQIVDIRPRRQFERGHIPGAINLPFARLPQEMADVDWDDEIVVACPEGKSSRQAARLIQSFEGVDDDARVLNLDGGYREWEFDLDAEG